MVAWDVWYRDLNSQMPIIYVPIPGVTGICNYMQGGYSNRFGGNLLLYQSTARWDSVL